MADSTYTPPELARVVRPSPRRSAPVTYKRDVYWFATTSVTQGSSQPVVSIPANGPGAAGATFPAIQPQVESASPEAATSASSAASNAEVVMNYTPCTVTVSFIQGDQLILPLALSRPDFDFTGSVVRADVRADHGQPKLAEFTGVVTPGGVGAATVTLTLNGTSTENLPNTCYSDVELSKPSVSFGPYTFLRLKLLVQESYTYDD